jgi:hypothetical protein
LAVKSAPPVAMALLKKLFAGFAGSEIVVVFRTSESPVVPRSPS